MNLAKTGLKNTIKSKELQTKQYNSSDSHMKTDKEILTNISDLFHGSYFFPLNNQQKTIVKYLIESKYLNKEEGGRLQKVQNVNS